MSMQPGRTGGPEINPTVMMVFLVISLAVVAPNLLLFSTDDLFIFIDTGLRGRFSLSQAGEGRYTFAALCQIIRFLGFSSNSYLAVSNLAFCMSLSVFFCEILRLLRIESKTAQICGFLSFISFGFNLDLYQFVFAQLSYSVAFLGLALVMRIASSEIFDRMQKLAISSIIATAAIGSYQIYTVLALLLGLSLISAGIFRDRLGGKVLGATIILFVSDTIGSILYFLINHSLHAADVPGFISYPRREQGIRFLSQNFQKFASTAHDILILNDHNVYSPLLPLIVKLMLCGVLIILCFGLRGSRRAWLTMFGLISLSFILWIDPVNMLLSSYWPSARSMSSFCVFVGVAVTVIAERFDDRAERTRMQTAAFAIIVLLIASQAMTGMLRLRDRFIRQTEDIVLAQTITSDVLEQAQGTDVVQITIGADQEASSKYSENVFDYGRSLFQTSWSAPALIDFVSNGGIAAKYDLKDECRGLYRRNIVVIQQEGRMLVCAKYE